MPRYQHHVSGLRMYWRCPAQYEQRYVYGRKVSPSAAIVVGWATDDAVTLNLNAKIATGQLMAVADVEDAARQSVNERWQQGVLLHDDEPAEPIARGQAVDESVELAALHARGLAPWINARATRWDWTLDIAGTNESLAGTADILDGEGVRDTKTTRKAFARAAVDQSTQLTMYALALARHGPGLQAVIPVTLDVLVKHKDGAVAQVLESTRSAADYNVLYRRIETTLAAIHAGHFPPCHEDSWWCSPRWCGYYDSCRYVRHPVQVVI